MRRLPDPHPRWTTSGTVVVALAGINVTDHLLHPPWWVRAAEGAALVAWARADGLTWTQLALDGDHLASGCRWALGAIGVVSGAYAVGVLLPPARPAFQDVRYDLPLLATVRVAFVAIPFGTVALEELAFRSVLWAVLAQHLRQGQVLVTTSAVFGFWHVIPALHVRQTNQGLAGAAGSVGSGALVTGTVVLTALGGLVFGELRRRSGSVLASAGAHWATNALGVLFGMLAWRLERQRARPPLRCANGQETKVANVKRAQPGLRSLAVRLPAAALPPVPPCRRRHGEVRQR